MRSLIPWGRGGERNDRSEVTPFFNLHREIDRLFEDTFRSFASPLTNLGNWPAIDVAETDDELRVRAELPGLDEKDVEVTMADGALVIRGKHEEEKTGKLYSERFAGSFERRIMLPASVEEDGVQASFHNGLLTVTMKKTAKSRVKRIEINGGSGKLISH